MQADDSTGSPVRVYQRPRRWPRLLGRIGILAGILLLTAAVSWWVWTAFIRP